MQLNLHYGTCFIPDLNSPMPGTTEFHMSVGRGQKGGGGQYIQARYE